MNRPGRIVALVLAAGYSSRMDGFKPLAPLGGSTFIERAVTLFLNAGISDVRVVIGHRAGELAPVLDALGVRRIFNAGYDLGMFSSILAGVDSLEPGTDAFFLLPCDIPLVKSETVRSVLNAFDPSDPKIVYPSFRRRRGHPPLIPVGCLEPDLRWDYPGGLRAILDRYEHRAVDVDVPDENILIDCDTPSDYAALKGRRSTEDVPDGEECASILTKLGVPQNVIAHSIKVAELAGVLAVYLNFAGAGLSLPLVLASGLLHDIARDRPRHAAEGSKLLAEMGYPRVGSVAARHMDIESTGPSVDEAELIYYADKCVDEDRLVDPEDRFQKSLDKYAGTAGVREKILARLDNTRKIGRRIESVIGCSVAGVVRRHEIGLRSAHLDGRRLIFLARHGAIESPAEPKRFIGQIEVPLGAEGRRQAESLAKALEGASLSAVFCSDLERSFETAKIVAESHGVPYVPRSDLREISLGGWEGLSFDEVRKNQPDEFNARGADVVYYRPPGGESFHDCALRVLPAFHEILNTTRGNILIVGHAGVNRIILSRILSRPLEKLFEIGQDYGCLNVALHNCMSLEIRLLNVPPSGLDLSRFLSPVISSP